MSENQQTGVVSRALRLVRAQDIVWIVLFLVLGATSDTGLTTPSAFPHTAASLVAATAARFYAYLN